MIPLSWSPGHTPKMVPTVKLVSTMDEPSSGSNATLKPSPCKSTGSGTSSLHAYFTQPCVGTSTLCNQVSFLLYLCKLVPTVDMPSDARRCLAAALQADYEHCVFTKPCICASKMHISTHRVLQRLEEQLVRQHVHRQLLVAKGVDAVQRAARRRAHLRYTESLCPLSGSLAGAGVCHSWNGIKTVSGASEEGVIRSQHS